MKGETRGGSQPYRTGDNSRQMFREGVKPFRENHRLHDSDFPVNIIFTPNGGQPQEKAPQLSSVSDFRERRRRVARREKTQTVGVIDGINEDPPQETTPMLQVVKDLGSIDRPSRRGKSRKRVAELAVAAIYLAACGTGSAQTQEANITPKLACYGDHQIRTGETGPYTLKPGDSNSKVIVALREVTSPNPGVIEVAERPDLSDTAYVRSDKTGYVDHNGFAISFTGGEVLRITSDGRDTITEVDPLADEQYSITAKINNGRTDVNVSGKCTNSS